MNADHIPFLDKDEYELLASQRLVPPPQRVVMVTTPNGSGEKIFSRIREAFRQNAPTRWKLQEISQEEIKTMDGLYTSEEARAPEMKEQAEPCQSGQAKYIPPLPPLLKALLNRAVPPKKVNTMFGQYEVPAFE